jgi:purine-nucleoside phosphorylase
MITPHIAAEKGAFAPTVLMPGDPIRAQLIAQNYLDDVVQITGVRNMLGFTGKWKGAPVSIMGSGIGIPSAGIYSYELFHYFGVKRIIRTGSAGSLQENVKIGDMVFALSVSTDSNFASQYGLQGTFSPCADFSLLRSAVRAADANEFKYAVGSVFSSDFYSYYNALGADASWKKWAQMGCLAVEMDAFAVYCNAAQAATQALTILMVTNHCITGETSPDESRLFGLEPMYITALETAAEQHEIE